MKRKIPTTTKKIVADVPIELHQQIKAKAAMMNKSMDQFIKEAVLAQLAQSEAVKSGKTQIDMEAIRGQK